MDAIAFIFARGGSKGLPGKNIKPLSSKPLIAWAIHHAQAVKRIRRVIVSTDSEEIASVARKYGAEVPFLRPPELAQDDSPELNSWKHALDYIQQEENQLPDVMVSVPVTAPLRLPIDIENCLDLYSRAKPDVVVTVTDAHRSPYFNMIKKNKDGTVGLVIPPDKAVSRRQDVPDVFDMTTVAYAVDPQYIMESDSIFGGRVMAVHVPVERSIDIDTLLDFQIAEHLMRLREESDNT